MLLSPPNGNCRLWLILHFKVIHIVYIQCCTNISLRSHVTVVMTVMAVSVFEMYENAKLAREMAVMGNYESSGVYYEGTLQQINRLVMASDQSNKQKWLSVSNIWAVLIVVWTVPNVNSSFRYNIKLLKNTNSSNLPWTRCRDSKWIL